MREMISESHIPTIKAYDYKCLMQNPGSGKNNVVIGDSQTGPTQSDICRENH